MSRKWGYNVELLKSIHLRDDDTETGGKAFSNETLYDFLESVWMQFHEVEAINRVLKECGIMPLTEEECELLKRDRTELFS